MPAEEARRIQEKSAAEALRAETESAERKASMSTALAKVESQSIAVTGDQLDLIRRTVAQGATEDELRLYLYDCQRQGVHPLDKLLHFTKRGGKYVPITSIDLMRTRAADTREHCGSEDPIFEGEPGKPGFKATVVVHRLTKGKPYPFTASARWEEYYPGEQLGFQWRKMPHTMLGKCAEALALRKAFPRQLASLYANEEMDQAERPHWGDSGSKEAAQAVAAQKIAAMETRTENVTATEANAANGKPTTKNFEFLKIAGELKADIGEDAYYECLKAFGVEHANLITERDDQKRFYAALVQARTQIKNRYIKEGGGELYGAKYGEAKEREVTMAEANELYRLANTLEQPPDVVDKQVMLAIEGGHAPADCIKIYKQRLKDQRPR
jgi:phage recombination protein Bet